MGALPMFPLGTVLVPGGGLPLHVFEERYRTMVRDVLAADGPAEFGVVLITRGTEVGGGDQRADVACVARILDAEVTADGRYGLLTGGHRRVRVTRWLPDDPYPRAEVEDWPDDDADVSGLLERVARLRDRITPLRARLGVEAEPPDALGDGALADAGPVMASYRLSVWTPMGPADAQRALAAPGPAARLAVLDDVVDDLTAVADFREGPG